MDAGSSAAPTASIEEQSRQAATVLQQRWDRRPRFGIILGTGAGRLAEEIQAEAVLPYGDLPHFPTSTAMGHKGRFVGGTLAGHAVLAMQGRFHLYEGYSVDRATLPVHLMHHLGVNVLFVSNASGGINPQFQSGQIMLIDSHVDFMYRSTVSMSGQVVQGRPALRSDAYDGQLIRWAQESARRQGIVVHQGVYAGLLGPNYETRAEYRFLRRIGGDVAGMSTIPEVAVAARYGMRVLGMSIVSNVAKPDVLEATSGQEVIDAAAVAAPGLKRMVVDVIQAIAENEST